MSLVSRIEYGIWNGMMELSKLVFLCQKDEIIMTHGCIATIVEFGQVAMHLIYGLSYFCATTATLVIKYLLHLMRVMAMEVYIMQ